MRVPGPPPPTGVGTDTAKGDVKQDSESFPCTVNVDVASGLTPFDAVAVTVVPVYVLNRYWVWGKKDKNNFVTEILPFWGMTLLGLIISTLCVAYADSHFESPLMVNLANAFGFGLVWVLKFAVLDRIVSEAGRSMSSFIGADEEKLFEKSSIRFMIMEDHETVMPPERR